MGGRNVDTANKCNIQRLVPLASRWRPPVIVAGAGGRVMFDVAIIIAVVIGMAAIPLSRWCCGSLHRLFSSGSALGLCCLRARTNLCRRCLPSQEWFWLL